MHAQISEHFCPGHDRLRVIYCFSLKFFQTSNLAQCTVARAVLIFLCVSTKFHLTLIWFDCRVTERSFFVCSGFMKGFEVHLFGLIMEIFIALFSGQVITVNCVKFIFYIPAPITVVYASIMYFFLVWYWHLMVLGVLENVTKFSVYQFGHCNVHELFFIRSLLDDGIVWRHTETMEQSIFTH